MTRSSPKLAATCDRVLEFLHESVGATESLSDSESRFPFGSTVVTVRSYESEESDTFVEVHAEVATAVPAGPDLFRWLATASNDLRFGRITCSLSSGEETADLDVRHTLLGDFLDLEELRSAVAFVAESADAFDDEVVEKFGGTRFVDRAP